MYPALVYCMICEFAVGRIKLPMAIELHDKALVSDARMNRADWLTDVAALVGITGVAFGWWWADATAAALIAIEILRDGIDNIRQSVGDLLDKVPTEADEDEHDDWAGDLRKRLQTVEWIREFDFRLREEGIAISGEVFVVARDNENLAGRGDELNRIAREVDWRFYELLLVPVERL